MSSTKPTAATSPPDEKAPKGDKAAQDDAAIPDSSDKRPVGAVQAQENRDNDSPS